MTIEDDLSGGKSAAFHSITTNFAAIPWACSLRN
jgi:hypothetical protein